MEMLETIDSKLESTTNIAGQNATLDQQHNIKSKQRIEGDRKRPMTQDNAAFLGGADGRVPTWRCCRGSVAGAVQVGLGMGACLPRGTDWQYRRLFLPRRNSAPKNRN